MDCNKHTTLVLDLIMEEDVGSGDREYPGNICRFCSILL
jgi:hypothetical protein